VETNHSDFSKTNLHNADLVRANLNGAYFSGGNLGKANMRFAILMGVNFSGAYFEGADLSNAKLSKAFYPEGNDTSLEFIFQVVSFYNADLSEADLSNANFSGTIREGANLLGAALLSYDQLSQVKTLYNAHLDEEYRIPLKAEHTELFEKP